MSTTTRLIILDDIMLPYTQGEIGLNPAEAAFAANEPLGADVEIPALVLACRAPEGTPSKSLNAHLEAGDTLKAGLLVSGVLWPARGDELPDRLVINEASRVTIERLEPTDGGWLASYSAWPYIRDGLEGIDALVQAFYKVLVTTRDPDDDALKAQLEEPIGELEGAEDALSRLFLLADYLVDSPEARQRILSATSSHDVHAIVSEVLSLITQEIPTSPRALRQGVMHYLDATAREGMGQMHTSAKVLQALAPLLEASKTSINELAALTEEIASVQARFEVLVTRLLSQHRS